MLVIGTFAVFAWPIAGRSFMANIPPASQTDRAAEAEARVRPTVEQELVAAGLSWGSSALIRIFKKEGELELWLTASDGSLKHFRTWPICAWSGQLGPKLREGDGQAPEGYYAVTASALNPRSQFHLSFDLGYPNAFDRAHGRTGSYLMVHGNCVSVGCYAMGDEAIEVIYSLLAAALANGQAQVPVQAYPFRFSPGWQEEHRGDAWFDFWSNLAEGDVLFQRDQRPPRVSVANGRYVFMDGS